MVFCFYTEMGNDEERSWFSASTQKWGMTKKGVGFLLLHRNGEGISMMHKLLPNCHSNVFFRHCSVFFRHSSVFFRHSSVGWNPESEAFKKQHAGIARITHIPKYPNWSNKIRLAQKNQKYGTQRQGAAGKTYLMIERSHLDPIILQVAQLDNSFNFYQLLNKNFLYQGIHVCSAIRLLKDLILRVRLCYVLLQLGL